MRISTIGFMKKSTEKFFYLVKKSAARRVVDVRLNNVSQLAGFAKRDDLIFFLKVILDIDCLHLPELAPTKIMLVSNKKEHRDWERYEREFLDLMEKRGIESKIQLEAIADGCLLYCRDASIYMTSSRLDGISHPRPSKIATIN